MRLLLVDDNDLVRTALRQAIELNTTFEVVGEACDGRQAVELVDRLEPDVVLMDVMMPVMDGIEATRAIKGSRPDVIVLAFSSSGETSSVAGMIAAGATGYVIKGTPADQLIYSLAGAAGPPVSSRRATVGAERRRPLWGAAR